jgi:hypothetical protein
VAQARRRPGLARTAAIAAAAAAGIACGGGPGAELARRFPDAAAIPGQRLADANPYVLPHDGRVRFFHCRWDPAAPIPVAFPANATAAERRAIDEALDAWEQAVPGVRFEGVAPGTPGIELELVGGSVETPVGEDTANTVVDCRIAPLSQQTAAAVADARLVSAHVRIARRTNADWQDKRRDLTEAELVGTTLHEVGHALGFQGHARQGDTVMVREVERVARTGKKLLAGEGYRDPTLRALYRLPSGAVVGGGPVERCRTDHVDRMARLAETNGLAGPFVRVGEAAARIFWRDEKGAEYGLILAKLREALRAPAKLLVIAESNVRFALAPRLDVPCDD